MAEFNALKTPDEFINYYSALLKQDLSKYDLQINKLGFIGFFLNILGWSFFDVKQYYDYLFKESFVATSKEDENLYLHSSIYGYMPSYASPATAIGNFVFDFSVMPAKPDGVVKRQVTFDNIVFKNDEYFFESRNSYRFIEEDNTYYCVIFNWDGGIDYISSSSPLIQAPFRDVRQIERRNVGVTIQNYNFGSFYPYIFTIEDGFLTDLNVTVKIPDTQNWEEFDITPIKYFVDSFDNVAFLRNLTATKFLLEFGSGIRGAYVPKTEAELQIDVTKGAIGNLNISKKCKLENTVAVDARQYFENSDIPHIISGNIKDIMVANFEYSSGAADPVGGESLRRSIVQFIQTRNNLISEIDYYNVASRYFNDFKFLFRKSQITDNIFYLHRVFRDKYQIPVKSINYSISLISDHDLEYTPPVLTGNFYIDEDGALESGTYDYFVQATDNFGRTVASNTVSVTIDGDPQNSIQLTWTDTPNAFKYCIYGHPEDIEGITYYTYWETFDTELIDIGTNEFKTEYIPQNDLICFPNFKVNNREFISPLIYEYDAFMDWYKTYLLYESMIVTFKDITYRNISYDIPAFYFHIVYNRYRKKTYIYIKSHQDIADYNIKCTMSTIGIYNQFAEDVNENTKQLVFSDSESNGILMNDENEIDIVVYDADNVKIVSGISNTFRHIYDLTDQLKLIKYEYDGDEQIMNIPVIDKDTYDEDSIYYLDKIYEFLISHTFDENRMITDEVQFRFLNTNNRSVEFSQYELLQTYLFDIVFPLNMYVKVYIDQKFMKENPNFDLASEKKSLLLELADTLNKKYTGADIKYYNSQIIELVHYNRTFIKSVEVEVTDSTLDVDGSPLPNTISDGLESKEIRKILEDIALDETYPTQERKFRLLRYTPGFYWWDVDNIKLEFIYPSDA